jgi:hypothetical protein
MPWGIASLGVGVVSGIANFLSNQSANDRAQMVQQQQFQKWMELNIPDPAEQKIALQNFVSQGTLSPKMQEAISQEPSEFSKIVTDSGNKAAQTRALSQLEDIGDSGGLRLQDKAALQDSMLSSQARDRGNRQGIAADMARRGMGGSGYDVAAQLQGLSTTSDQNANNSLKVAAGAQDRALQSILGAGDLATKYRTQDFGEQSAKATAADRINQFNTANLRDVNASNVGATNRASEMNLANSQRLSDQNTALANSQQMYNKNLLQQNYENQIKQLQGATGQSDKIAAGDRRTGELQGNAISNIGNSASQAFGSLANADQQDKYWDNYFKAKDKYGEEEE